MPYNVTKEQAQKMAPMYKIEQRLTLSSFKAAFKATDQTGRAVCLKIVDPNYPNDRLQRELLAMGKLDHPNIAKLLEYYFSVFEGVTVQYIVEEFIDGTDLTAALGSVWELSRIRTIFAPLCSALEVLRIADLVHRDLKPSNIRLSPNDVPSIIDFGVARHLDQPDLTATAHGARIGTPQYFAPEQFRGTKADIEHRTDLFALGIILYQAATGIHPFDPGGRMTVVELEAAICDGNEHLHRPEFNALDSKLQLILSKLLSRSRADRPANASQIEKLIHKLGAR